MDSWASQTAQPKAKQQRHRGESAAADDMLHGADDASDDSDGRSKKNVRTADVVNALRSSTEALRMCRELNAAVFLTFIFAKGAVSEALLAAGAKYDEDTKKKVKGRFPPCVGKWAALTVSLRDATTSFLASGSAGAANEPVKAALATLDAHIQSISAPALLNAVGLHSSHRMNHDKTRSILTVASSNYQGIVDCITVLFKALYDYTPESGPAPATKAERKARASLRRLAPKE